MELTLRFISDDYEYFGRIIEDVTGWAAERGLGADRETIQTALEGLISGGYAQSYFLPDGIEPVSYSAGRLDELSFYLTPKGLQLVRELQEGWR